MIMGDLKLNDRQQEFFRVVRLAISVNPFSDERLEADRFLGVDAEPGADNNRIRLLIMVVEEQLSEIFGDRERSFLSCRGEDTDLVKYGLLFHVFHRYCHDFDHHIQIQIDSGEKACPVSFAGKALGEMKGCGLNSEEASLYFSLFFQMRRAFYFINRIIGKSPCMKKLRRDLWNNIFTYDIGLYEHHLRNRMEDFSTLLLGGTGTGKGLAAAAIGRSGYIPFAEKSGCFAESFTGAFISLNLSQFPEQLLESELFGHKKGAFTGAVESHEGIFARCSRHGAIFLDEIGEVSIPVQIKLLQVLQERNYSPVGSHTKKRFEGRVIAATNRPLDKLRREGGFRDDFYYRLCSDIIHIPALQQRLREDPAELADLVDHTISRIIGRPAPELAASSRKLIRQSVPADYSWPGNVRELEQCIRRILLKKSYEVDCQGEERDGPGKLLKDMEQGELSAQELLGRYCKMLYGKMGTYEAVARQIELDRRTVKKYVDAREES